MEMTCILCPMGCRLVVTEDDAGVRVSGNSCKRGEKYGEQELLSPMRVVTSSVRVSGAAYPVCAVKTAGQVPKAKIPEVLRAIRGVKVVSPVRIGDVLIQDAAGTGIAVVATANR